MKQFFEALSEIFDSNGCILLSKRFTSREIKFTLSCSLDFNDFAEVYKNSMENLNITIQGNSYVYEKKVKFKMEIQPKSGKLYVSFAVSPFMGEFSNLKEIQGLF